MRELLFKNLTSPDNQRRILSISEKISQDGIEVTTQRRSAYRLKDCIHVKDLPGFKQNSDVKQPQKNHFYVIRKRDSRTGEDKLFCKVQGSLYVVREGHLYLIAFKNFLKIGMKAVEGQANQGGE